MQLKARLRKTTLGDLLGTLYRARANGVLELVETVGAIAGRAHHIHLREGRVAAVDSELGGLPQASELERLEALFRLPDAAIAFRVARPRLLPLPLEVREYLHGRPRARDRDRDPVDDPTITRAGRPLSSRAPVDPGPRPPSPRARALALLGLAEGASPEQIRTAFRDRAKEVHPDRFPRASAQTQKRMEERLAALTEAYHRLVR